ncbi:MAG: response regulator transcription factor [Selenomonadaceae bacterium]|nr:response regulator transcription factor [Selenomonadaceae bacterium]MBR6886172.1 response regulator transcription factor [Bacteroidales bacterium]
MIKAILLDDEPLALRQLEAYSAKVPFLEVIGAFTSARAAMSLIPEADVLFLDINMPDMNGMDLVHSLDNPPLIVFTTAYSDYAVEGFKVRAVDYLLKPISFRDFSIAAEKVLQIFELKEISEERSRVLYFRSGGSTVPVHPADILYVESMSEYVKIHFSDGREPLVTLYALKKLAEELPGSNFLQIHRTYIVSMTGITAASLSSVTLKDGTVLPVAESHRPALASRFRPA